MCSLKNTYSLYSQVAIWQIYIGNKKYILTTLTQRKNINYYLAQYLGNRIVINYNYYVTLTLIIIWAYIIAICYYIS